MNPPNTQQKDCDPTKKTSSHADKTFSKFDFVINF